MRLIIGAKKNRLLVECWGITVSLTTNLSASLTMISFVLRGRIDHIISYLRAKRLIVEAHNNAC